MRLSVAAHHHEMTQPFKKPYTPAFQKALFPKVAWPWKRNLYFPKFSKSWFVNAVAILKFKAEEHFFFSSIIKKRITACHTFRGKYSQKYPALQRSKSFRICAQHRMQMCHFRTPRYVCAAAKYKQVCNKAGESFRAIHWRNNMCGWWWWNSWWTPLHPYLMDSTRLSNTSTNNKLVIMQNIA